MADLRNYQMRTGTQGYADASIDEGLRSYMLKVYNLMALGMAITGLAAWGGSPAPTPTPAPTATPTPTPLPTPTPVPRCCAR